MITPKMTKHAVQRCAEMGISTKVAKRIVRNPSITHAAREGRMVATSVDHPDYAVVYAADRETESVWVITVLFNTQVRYERNGVTWVEK